MKDTKEAIVETAHRILNARGLAALSTRAVAEELGLSPGNVSYHFPRKEVLVQALAERHGESNRSRLERPLESVGDFLEIFREVFRGQYRFRGLVLALPEIMESFDEVRTRYRKSVVGRQQRLFAMLTTLVDRGALEATEVERTRIVSHLSFIGRFWLAEARVSYPKVASDRVIDHYLALVADTLLPYATEASRRELQPYLGHWIDDGTRVRGGSAS